MHKLLLIFLYFCLLAACHPSPEIIRKVNELTYIKKDKTVNCPITNTTRCAIDTPLLDLYNNSLITGKDYVSLLEKGENSLLVRLHLIKAAQTSIDIQTFIWVNDESGHLVLAELLEAAKRGVRVNIIIDQLFSMGDTWFLAELATLHANLNIRLFNPVFNEAHTSVFDFVGAIACCLYSLNRRMHNKLFLIDGKYGITGGRNYNDRYFDWDPNFNYKDRDALVIGGTVAQQMKASFAEFWHAKWVVPLENLDDIVYRILNNQEKKSNWAVAYKRKSSTINLKSYNFNYIQKKFTDTAIAVDSVEYFSDSPDKLFTKNRQSAEKYKQMTLKIKELILSAEKKLLLQTPYLVLSRKAYRALKSLHKNKPDVQITVSTNSLSSTDAYYVYAISFKHKKKYMQRLGLNIYEYKQNPKYKHKMFGAVAASVDTRFGLHAKSIVIDGYTSLIGSHNFDHRSDILNTESGLIIKSTELAKQLSQFIDEDMSPENSWIIAPNKKIPVLSFFSGMMATLSRSLPVLDIWPFRYSSSFQLRYGKVAVGINHPDFYENYKNVGNFPDVELSSRQIQTIMISAFAGFAEPFM
ncbi:Cardiolipin synthetase [hydrothermal vent metagenome]|uniref:Cardiolipin synthetase n=1 Tax=hydrothermal vent metagenome TaxID=652676 RepID=A0A3B0VL26_9ZZZZ